MVQASTAIAATVGRSISLFGSVVATGAIHPRPAG
jgi:hypothetical protein